MSGTRMPLEVLRVAEPCRNDWDAMTGDDRTRFCAGCGLHVHNLSAMTRDEAERLVCERAGRLCVRYEQTPQGGVKTLEYAGRPAQRTWRFWTAIGALGALAAAMAQGVMKRPGGGTAMGMMVVGSVASRAVINPPQPLGPPTPDATGGTWPPVAGGFAQLNPEPPAPFGPAGPPAPEQAE